VPVIAFAMPAFAHLMYLDTHLSFMALQRDLIAASVPHDFITTGNESLVSRARNIQVKTFLTDPRFAKLDAFMFIDADMGFDSEDVGKLWQMNKDVVVGAYPMKRPERPPTTVWLNGKLVDLTQIKLPTQVDYAGTGFMMIRRRVFERLAERHSEWEVEDHDGVAYHCFFQASIPEDRVELSEDYFFCKRWREIGGEIWVDPSIRLRHWGAYKYASQ
jgi:hypothetical protein